MLPAIVFAVTAITRDAERRTTELFFTTPVPRAAFLLGRFSAGTLAAIAVGCVGLLGALAGSFMPWLDPARIAPFDWRPWAASLVLLVLPNLLVFCALFFSVAALTRSTALTFGAALGVLVLALVVNLGAAAPVPRWLAAGRSVRRAAGRRSRALLDGQRAEHQLPTALLAAEPPAVARTRALRAAVHASRLPDGADRAALCPPVAPTQGRGGIVVYTSAACIDARAALLRFDARATLLQLVSQLRMDWRGVRQSPLFWLVLAHGRLVGIWGEASTLRIGSVPLLSRDVADARFRPFRSVPVRGAGNHLLLRRARAP